MPLELRPNWCLTDASVDDVVEFGDWMTSDGRQALGSDGDDWRPGEKITLTRTVEPRLEPIELRRRLDLAAGQTIGVAARWSCRATAAAGVHAGGPAAMPLVENTTITLDIPTGIAGSIEVETCLVVSWTTTERPADSSPHGALVWSDGWTRPIRERTMLLEGSEARIPVRTVSFDQHFGRPSGALWAIDLDTSIDLDDLLSNVVTVLLNKDVTTRDFPGPNDEPDASRIPDSTLAGMSVDLVRSLTSVLAEDLQSEELTDLADGTVGAMLVQRLTEAFGSISSAIAALEHDEPTFTRELWNRFAPNSWSGGT